MQRLDKLHAQQMTTLYGPTSNMSNQRNPAVNDHVIKHDVSNSI